MVAVSWWSRKSSGHRAGEEAVRPAGLPSACGRGLSVSPCMCAGLRCSLGSQVASREAPCPEVCGPESQAEPVSSLCDLVLEVVSPLFCHSHKSAQVQVVGT